MTGHDEKRRGFDDIELERLLKSARAALPQPSPAFRDSVMAAIHARTHTQNPVANRHAPPTPAWRFAMPVALSLLAATAIYFAAPWGVTPPPTTTAPAGNLVGIRFTLQAPRAKDVRLAGSFTQWEPRHALRRDSYGLWTVEIPLTPGRYEYLFVVDGREWVPDPRARQSQDDGYGGKNSVIMVTTNRHKERSHVEAI